MWAVLVGGMLIKGALKGTRAVIGVAKQNQGHWRARDEMKKLEEEHGEASFSERTKVVFTKEEAKVIAEAKDPLRMHVAINNAIMRGEAVQELKDQTVEVEVIFTVQELKKFQEMNDPQAMLDAINKALDRAVTHKELDETMKGKSSAA